MENFDQPQSSDASEAIKVANSKEAKKKYLDEHYVILFLSYLTNTIWRQISNILFRC